MSWIIFIVACDMFQLYWWQDLETRGMKRSRQEYSDDDYLREIRYRDKPCEYCSSFKNEICHHHFSTSMQRVFHILWTNGNFICPICQTLESAVRGKNEIHRVILSDSTLYGVWDNPELPKVSTHFDIECIVGGRIRDLTVALKKNILRNDYRFEIVVIGGINNIGEGQSAAEIMNEFSLLKEAVADHSRKHLHVSPSYVSVCTLILPPKYCSLRLPEDMRGLEAWKPPRNFINRYPVIKEVNEKIKKMNLDSGLAYLNLHMQGIKMLKSGPQHKFDNKPGAKQVWREQEVFKKLHFTAENKLKVVQYLQNKFKNSMGKPGV